MSTRRRFIQQSAAATAALALAPTTKARVATSPSSRIQSVVPRYDRILRLGGAGGVGGFTWLSDDRQLFQVGDGPGWPRDRRETYNTCLFTVSGEPCEANISPDTNFPEFTCWSFAQGGAPYYGGGPLAVDGKIYLFLATDDLNYSLYDFSLDKRDEWIGRNFTNSKLIFSPDNGRTWCNQNGSTPVVAESKKAQSHETMAFFHEPQDIFSWASFLQMGKDYRANRDGYVYVYSPNGMTEGTMNQLVMFRVPKARVLDRRAYEYFGGLHERKPRWVKSIDARAMVHTFPGGWMDKVWPVSWIPNVVYNPALEIYMMVCSSGGSADGTSKRGYAGIWVADDPWGPWRQVYENVSDSVTGDAAANVGGGAIAPKWIAADGKSFWMVWSDGRQTTAEDVTTAIYHPKDHDDLVAIQKRYYDYHPYTGFNMSRFDIVVN